MDVVAVQHAATAAVESVRSGGGPHFLELRTYRFRAHSMYDPERYRDRSEVAAWKERDPIDHEIARLTTAGLVDDAAIAEIEAEVAAEIDDAVTFAEAGTPEDVADLTRFVISETEVRR
jgi:pyruvate dehydrogenase E1 component alpha subunit